MKIKLLTNRVGANFSQSYGEIIDVADDEAWRMIEDGQAIPIVEEKKEKAIRKTREKR